MLKPVAWSQTKPVVEGLDYLDGFTGPAVFVANHSFESDNLADCTFANVATGWSQSPGTSGSWGHWAPCN